MKMWKKLIAAAMSAAMLAAYQPAALAYEGGSFSTQMGMRVSASKEGTFKETGDEIMIVESKLLEEIQFKGDYNKLRERLSQGLVRNGVVKGKTIPSANIKTLVITADSFGVVVEPETGTDFVIDYIGVGEPKAVQLDTNVANNTLSVDVKGSHTGSRILCTAENERVNVIRIGVPAAALENIQVSEEELSCILVNQLNIPVSAKMINGIIRVQDETVKNKIDMEATSGDLLVIGKKITGPVKLTVTSGDAVVKADSATGTMEVNATSGDVTVSADQVSSAVIKATSGDVHADIGTILNRVDAEISSGDMTFRLLKQPTDLTFECNGKHWTDDVTLPSGWTDGYTIGNGKPVLNLRVGSGDMTFKIG